ncbi:MAG: hypothetical protein ACFB0G_00625 [Leptolyngbyaceae cyanobacterium]
MLCVFDEDFRASSDDQSVFRNYWQSTAEFLGSALTLVSNLTALTAISQNRRQSALAGRAEWDVLQASFAQLEGANQRGLNTKLPTVEWSTQQSATNDRSLAMHGDQSDLG